MRIALNVLVGVIALLLGGGLGLRWMFDPATVAAGLGIGLENVTALSTGRADLGGFFLGAGALCLLGLRRGYRRWLEAVAVLIACIALGRAVSLVLDGFERQLGIFLLVEVVMVAVLLAAARPARVAS